MVANDEERVRSELGKGVIYLSRLHRQRVDALMEERDPRREMSGCGQIPVLMELRHHGQLSQRQLAEKIRVTPATISGTLKRMERMGLIRRTADQQDARVTQVTLTDLGHEKSRQAISIFEEVDEQMAEGLSEQEFSMALSLIRRMQQNLGGRPPRDEEEKA
jgi:DNA-binding MarR family transcriptional regulator